MIQGVLLGLVLSCNYSYFGAPFISVEYKFDDNGKAMSQAIVTHFGQSQTFSTRENPISADEKWNLTIAPNDPQNELQAKIFHSEEKGYTSILINQNSPVAKEMQGICQ